MVSRILFILMISAGSFGSAQEEYIQPGLLAASITYSPSTMLNHAQNNFYVTGFAEYYMTKKFSFRSDSYYFLNSQKENSVLSRGVSSYFGIAYHLRKGNWEGSVGFQPGITLKNRKVFKTRLEPSAAVRIGTTYYLWKYFHFFASMTYNRSKVNLPNFGTIQMDELTFSAGLGFQIQTKKKN